MLQLDRGHSPSPPVGGRGRGPVAAATGRVRWVPATALESPTSPRPSPPPNGAWRAEREIGAALLTLRPSRRLLRSLLRMTRNQQMALKSSVILRSGLVPRLRLEGRTTPIQ